MDNLPLIAFLAVFVLSFAIIIITIVRGGQKAARDTINFFTTPAGASRTPTASDQQIVRSAAGQRLLGLFVLGGGSYMVYCIWRQAMQGLGFEPPYAFIGPLFATLGLGVFLFPVDTELQESMYGSPKPRNWNELPLGLKITIVVSICVAAGNCFALYKLT